MCNDNKICANCRWCDTFIFPDIPCADMRCKQYPISKDRVTGYIMYAECADVCLSCDKWEQGGIKGFFQRLLKMK